MFSIIRRIGGGILAANYAGAFIYALSRGLKDVAPTVGQEVVKTAEFYMQTAWSELAFGFLSLVMVVGSILYGRVPRPDGEAAARYRRHGHRHRVPGPLAGLPAASRSS